MPPLTNKILKLFLNAPINDRLLMRPNAHSKTNALSFWMDKMICLQTKCFVRPKCCFHSTKHYAERQGTNVSFPHEAIHVEKAFSNVAILVKLENS